MENPPYLSVDVAPDPANEPRTASGIWSLDGDRLVSIENFAEGPAVVLVRSEHVLTLATVLPPLANAVRRREALPFAIEDQIAEPLDQVHIALGSEVGEKIWLAGVVRHDLMRQWLLRLSEAGLERAALVPDALSLPVPGPGCWSVDLAGDRAMIRAADATGFALPLAVLEPAWRSAGEPACIAYGEPLPPAMNAAQAELELEPLAKRLLVPALDLRQGRYALPRREINPLWRRIAMITAVGALAHGAIAAADTLALSRIASQRDAQVRALAASAQPTLIVGNDLSATLADLTPDAAATGPSQFLTLLSRSGGALAGLQRPISWRSLAFDRSVGTLTLAVEADDIASLQAVAQALTRAGLTAQPGAASVDQGRAKGSFAVRLP